MIDLSIIIVSYNTKQFTLQTIRSVYESLKNSDCSAEVIVVENSSTDGSYEAILDQFPKTILIRTTQLIGFAAANNLGFAKATGKHLLFLNPDTVVQGNAIGQMLKALQQHPLSVLSCQLLNEDSSLQHQGGALPNGINLTTWALGLDHLPFVRRFVRPYQQQYELAEGEVLETGWIGGTALMISTELFDKLGRWDDSIFMYGEDVELCLRASKQGATIGLILNEQIIHLKNKSTGSSAASVIGEMKNLIYVMRKHSSAPWRYLLIPYLKLVMIVGSLTRALIFAILRKNEARTHAYLKAIWAVFLA